MPSKEDVDRIYRKFKKRGYSDQEIANDFVFSMDPSAEELRELGALIGKRQSEISDAQRLKMNMLQLKIWMQDDASDSEFKRAARPFAFYLKEYRERLCLKNIELAKELAIDPTELSAVVNGLRSPGEKLIRNLGRHYKGNFPSLLWLKIFHREKEYSLFRQQRTAVHRIKVVQKAVSTKDGEIRNPAQNNKTVKKRALAGRRENDLSKTLKQGEKSGFVKNFKAKTNLKKLRTRFK
jgi:hypothetical protein